MSIVPFFSKFPQQAAAETRSVTVTSYRGVPNGEYAFIEFFCDDPKCDCRRVILRVIRKDTGPKIWATITFGWEPPEFYRRWTKFPELPGSGAALEPISIQSAHAPAILGLFEDVIQKDPAYVERLKRHYAQVKQAAGAKRDFGGRTVPQARSKPSGRYAWLMR